MKVFVSCDGDSIGAAIGRAILTDDVGEVRRVDQAIIAGNELFTSFAQRSGGQVVECGGDETRFEIPAEHLGDLEAVRQQYADAVGATVSVGVGTKLSESAKALMISKIRGKDQITLWHPDMQAELDAVTEKDESHKIAEEYLNKANDYVTGQNRGAHSGFDGHKMPKKNDKPAKDQDEGSAIKDVIQEQKNLMPPPPEVTHSADGLEDQFHQHASEQDQHDQKQASVVGDRRDQLKAQLVEVLGVVRQKSSVIAQIKDVDPQAYQALMALVQGVIALGREVLGDAPVKDKKDSPKEEPMAKEEKDPSAKEDEDEEEKEGEELDKSGGPIPGIPPQNSLQLPPGSTVNDRVKVRHADSATAWVKVGSGMVQGQEDGSGKQVIGTNSHPVPARQPGAR